METPRHGHPPIKMRYRPAGRSSDDGRLMPGDFWWTFDSAGRRRLVVGLPVPKSSRAIAMEWTINHKNMSDAEWSWDGNIETPTLNPSLHAIGHWHGWVKNGELIEA